MPGRSLAAAKGTCVKPETTLVLVKVVHTVAWAFFASCILLIPVVSVAGLRGLAAALSGLVLVEVAILLSNGWRCPLTDVAERYTDDRRDNFDIYLPLWLARHNKRIFGALFVLGEVVFAWSVLH